MDWATYIPGLTELIDAFFQTALGDLIMENREWLFEGLGVSLVLGIFAMLSAVARVVFGWGWLLCCFCAYGVSDIVARRRKRRTVPGPNDETQLRAFNEAMAGEGEERTTKPKPSPVLRPSPDEIRIITQVSPDFNPFHQAQAYSNRGPVGSAVAHGRASPARMASGGLPFGADPYFAWPRYFGLLARLLLLAALLNAIWVGYVWLR